MKTINRSLRNLAPPSPENLSTMRALVEEVSPPIDASEGAILWTRQDGFQFFMGEQPEGEPLPMPAYILGLCFVRLTTDPNFKQTMLDWAQRNKN